MYDSNPQKHCISLSKKEKLISFATILGMDFTILRILFWGDAILLQLLHGKILEPHLGLKIWLAVFDYL